MHRSRFAKLWLSVVFALAFPCGIVMANSAPVEDEGGTASEHGGIDYNKPPLNIEWPLLIFSAVLIGVGFLTLRGKVWEPLIAAFNARELQIKTAHAEAAMVGKQAEALMKEHAARMDVVYQQVKDKPTTSASALAPMKSSRASACRRMRVK